MLKTNSKKIIVLAEASKTLRKFITASLKKSDYEVIEFEEGLSALDYSIQNKPDCIVSDVILPKIDGLQLTSIVKFGSNSGKIPVILFSTDDASLDYWSDASGADKILTLSLDNIDDITKNIEELLYIGKVEAEIFADQDEKSKSEETSATICAVKAMEKNHFFFNMQKAAFELFKNIENLDELVKEVFTTVCKICDYDVAALVLNDKNGSFYTTGLEKLNSDDKKAFIKICNSDYEVNSTSEFTKEFKYINIEGIVKNPKENADFTSYNCTSLVDDTFVGTLHLASSRKNCFNYKVSSSLQYFTQNIIKILQSAVRFKEINQSEVRMRRAFSKFVPEEIIDDLLKSENTERQGTNEKRKVAILICDIRNFTTISEINQPENVVSFLNAYFSQMVDVIKKHGGSIDKFMGDAIMALFGAPISYVDNAQRAVSAAIEMIDLLSSIPISLLNFPKGISLDCGIGIHYGEAIVGNIGCKDKTDYTVIGDTVNLASRLEGLTKIYGSRIIVSQSVKDDISGELNLLHLDNVRVKGKSQGVEIYRVDSKSLPEEYSVNYEKGLDLYIKGAWTLALSYFEKALQIIPEEKAATLMIKRCKDFAQNQPENWNGAVALTSK